MARNSSGTYSAPTGQPVTSGTTISAATHNTLVSDLSTEITDSLSRSGKGGMTAPLRTADGAVSAPAHSYTNETGSGLYRAGSSDHRFAVAGTDRSKWTASGFFADVLTALTAVSATVKGAVADGASAVGVILDNTIALATAGAKLVSFRSNGSEKAAVDKDGLVLSPEHRALGATSVAVRGSVADGASAVGVVLDNTVDLTTGGSKIASFRSANVEKAYVANSGAVVSTSTAKAWCKLTLGAAGAVTVDRALNVSSASWSTNTLTINLTSAVSGTNACFVVSPGSIMGPSGQLTAELMSNASTVLVKRYDVSGAGSAQSFAQFDRVHVVLFD